MTPEELERTIEFIVKSHADAMIRMDRFDEELLQQKERVDALVSASNALLKVTGSVVGRTKRLEQRSDAAAEMIKVMREFIEVIMRRLDGPKPESADS